MKVLTFVSLFLGLVMGPVPVRLEVSDEVAKVEVLLDGQRAGAVRGPPWELTVDLGPRLEPHELVAVAYDAFGDRLTSISQWINLPRSLAEADFVVNPGGEGGGTIQITWRSVTAADPESVVVTLDEKVLPTPDFPDIELPPLRPGEVHFLRAELTFQGGVGAVAEGLLDGGILGGQTDVRLTSIPISIRRRSKVPTIAQMQGLWSIDGMPVDVGAVERGPADIVMVIDEQARKTLAGLLYDGRFRARLKRDQTLRLMLPKPEKVKAGAWRTTLFRVSSDFHADDGSLLGLMAMRYVPLEGIRGHQQLWDAVAVAGRLAASRGRRRAVVAVVSEKTDDRSDFSPRLVADYLAALHVPLVVWSPEHTRRSKGEWGRTVPIASHDQFNQAAYQLSNTLDRQAVVWLEGLHLPQRLRLSSNSSEFSLLETAPDSVGSSDEEPTPRKEAAVPVESIFGDVPPMSTEELDRIRSLLTSIPENCTPSCRQVIRFVDEFGWAPEGADIRFLAYVNGQPGCFRDDGFSGISPEEPEVLRRRVFREGPRIRSPIVSGLRARIADNLGRVGGTDAPARGDGR